MLELVDHMFLLEDEVLEMNRGAGLRTYVKRMCDRRREREVDDVYELDGRWC